MKNFDIPDTDYMYPGHLACPGCGASLGMRFALKALGENTMIVLPACCWSIIAGPFPYSAVKVPLFHTAFETAASVASGLRAALDMKGQKEVTVMAWAGDGGTFDIGLQALSGAAERNEDFIYVCYDNEAYMNTGIQRSSSTPEGAWTTTTPEGYLKTRPKKNIVEILAAHRIPYVATASVAFPDDFIRKLQKARQIKGTRFIHLFSPCPPGWKMSSDDTIAIARLAVHTKVFPLYEIEDGEKYTINIKPKGLPVQEYFKLQGRFRYLNEADYTRIQHDIDHRWAMLEAKAAVGNKQYLRHTA
ncbi:MAG: 3-methyl-2-oxobutanoate dehydrogenase subunit beta [candidate division KSB1 bacterium]|nr:3-methyl-2-oxobutanoate dehydrogenase subunit beta [candidate division KSB1 bacterium]MDZ7303523.1 3-methyl-2-oxobutanoate dehydrogenase subunit beta [candidate division KSB1 bacterium]MDZ7312675.1 3-methyl-2-oxobutanoate dehydrogenase subunit beta [candidate division KSB1 bacterium]